MHNVPKFRFFVLEFFTFVSIFSLQFESGLHNTTFLIKSIGALPERFYRLPYSVRLPSRDELVTLL